MPSLAEHVMPIRVRYSETDAMGFVHHANYFNYFEMGRTELFRAQGGNYRRMEELGLLLVVSRLNCRYRRPARYDDELTLRTLLIQSGPVKLIHEYRLYRGEELLAEAESTLACVNREGEVCRIPENLVEFTAPDAPP
jgi:acyl-CoA thioester hydrolase